MNNNIIPDNTNVEQAHLDFYHLMQSVSEVTCTAWAEATSEAERQAVREFECEVNDAIRPTNICQRIVNVKRVIKKWGIAL